MMKSAVILSVLLGFSLSQAATPGRVKVACLGDSITFGVGAGSGNSYPQQLGRLLGSRWDVSDFGHPGATLMNSGDLPYQKTPEFAALVASNPDVVVIMLGTNDSKDWNWAHQAEFKPDYEALVRKLEALPSKPKIWLVRPVPVMGDNKYHIREAPVEVEIPLINQVASELGAGIIDGHQALEGKTSFFPDNVHPNKEGAALLARAVYSALIGQAPNAAAPCVSPAATTPDVAPIDAAAKAAARLQGP